MPDDTRISIVIPAHNEERSLPLCLRAIENLDYPNKEIIIVDNNSTDRTQQVALKFRKNLNIKVISEVRKGRGAARARGFREATGDIIFSTDADTIVPQNWISEILPHFSDPAVDAVSGSCVFDDIPWISQLIMRLSLPFGVYGYRILFGHFWLSGFNFAIRRTIYNKTPGFNPSLNALEDVDLGFKVHAVGTIKYVSEPRVLTSGRRFNTGAIGGSLSYLKTFIGYYLSRGKKAYMEDVR